MRWHVSLIVKTSGSITDEMGCKWIGLCCMVILLLVLKSAYCWLAPFCLFFLSAISTLWVVCSIAMIWGVGTCFWFFWCCNCNSFFGAVLILRILCGFWVPLFFLVGYWISGVFFFFVAVCCVVLVECLKILVYCVGEDLLIYEQLVFMGLVINFFIYLKSRCTHLCLLMVAGLQQSCH